MNRIKNFIGKIGEWSELAILAPVTLCVFLFGAFLIHLIDPTAAILDVGTLSILAFNILVCSAINGLAFFFYKINFSDHFSGDWTKDLSPWQAATLNAALWFGTLGLTCFVLLRNL